MGPHEARARAGAGPGPGGPGAGLRNGPLTVAAGVTPAVRRGNEFAPLPLAVVERGTKTSADHPAGHALAFASNEGSSPAARGPSAGPGRTPLRRA